MRAVLTYHSIDTTGSVISVSPARFADDMRALAEQGVSVMSVTDVLREPGDRCAVAITFDDAFRNFLTEAWPVLQSHAFPVTLFVPSGFVGRTNGWEAMSGGHMPSLPILDWPELSMLASQGVELGGHSRRHPDLRALAPAAMVEEISGSIDDIEQQTGRRPVAFAYPYGHHDDDVVRVTRSTCQWACTTTLGALPPPGEARDLFRLPRLDAYFLRGPARLQHFGSRRFQSYLALRATIRRLRAS